MSKKEALTKAHMEYLESCNGTHNHNGKPLTILNSVSPDIEDAVMFEAGCKWQKQEDQNRLNEACSKGCNCESRITDTLLLKEAENKINILIKGIEMIPRMGNYSDAVEYSIALLERVRQ